VSRVLRRGIRRLFLDAVTDSVEAWDFGTCGREGWEGGLMVLRIASRLWMSWQRAEISERVLSRVGSMVKARERLLREATVVVWM
jgi:hypothetical protein